VPVVRGDDRAAGRVKPDLVVWDGDSEPRLFEHRARGGRSKAGLDQTVPAFPTVLRLLDEHRSRLSSGRMLGHGGQGARPRRGVESMSACKSGSRRIFPTGCGRFAQARSEAQRFGRFRENCGRRDIRLHVSCRGQTAPPARAWASTARNGQDLEHRARFSGQACALPATKKAVAGQKSGSSTI